MFPPPYKLLHGWQGNAFGGGPPGGFFDGTTQFLDGALSGRSALGPAFILAPAAHPSHARFLTVYTFGGTSGTVLVEPSGAVVALGEYSSNFTSLDSISFPAGI